MYRFYRLSFVMSYNWHLYYIIIQYDLILNDKVDMILSPSDNLLEACLIFSENDNTYYSNLLRLSDTISRLINSLRMN